MKYPQEKRFVKIYYVDFLKIITATEDDHLIILAYIIRYVLYNNEFNKTPQEVADYTGCHKRTVERVFVKLEESNFIFNIPDTERYMVNPDCCVRGTFPRYLALKKQYAACIKDAKKKKKEKEKKKKKN